MPVAAYSTVCARKRRLTKNVYELTLKKPENFQFDAGQFVLFDVPSMNDPTDIQPRAYSLASAPQDPELVFVIKLVPDGRASTWISRVVQEGTPFSIRGAFGSFLLEKLAHPFYLFAATGTGLAPLRSQIRHLLLEKKTDARIDLVFGAVVANDVFWEEDWRVLEAKFPNFHYHLSLMKGGRDDAHTGSLEKVLPEIIPHLSSVHGYFCGSPGVVSTLRKHAQKAWAMPEEQVHWEKYL